MGTGATISTGGGPSRRKRKGGSSVSGTSYYNKNQNTYSYGVVIQINDDKSIIYTPLGDRVTKGGEKKGKAFPFYGNNQKVPAPDNIVPLVNGPAQSLDNDPSNQYNRTTYYLDPVDIQGTVNENNVSDTSGGQTNNPSYNDSQMGFNGPANYTSGPVTKEVKTFRDVTIAVILNLEGGYYHPNMLKDGRVRDSRYGSSGETMYGLDRKAGGKPISDCEPCKRFWGILDQNNAPNTWRWNYIPPDPLKSQLLDLAVQIMEPLFTSTLNRYVPEKEIQDIIFSDGRLLFNFIYAQWNGPGWFQGWARDIRKAYQSGVKDSGSLTALFVRRRINNANLLSKGNKQNSLIAQGGNKIAKIVGVV
jgi:hypothetical protein